MYIFSLKRTSHIHNQSTDIYFTIRLDEIRRYTLYIVMQYMLIYYTLYFSHSSSLSMHEFHTEEIENNIFFRILGNIIPSKNLIIINDKSFGPVILC